MVRVYSGNPNSVPKKTGNGKGCGDKRIRKTNYKCKDGPYAGYTLALSSDSTCVFSVGSNRGRYVNGHWEEM